MAPVLGAIARSGRPEEALPSYFCRHWYPGHGMAWRYWSGIVVVRGHNLCHRHHRFLRRKCPFTMRYSSTSLRETNSIPFRALGSAWGTWAAACCLPLCIVMTLKPGWFGLTSATQAVQTGFYVTAVWWGVFSLPLFRHVHEKKIGARQLCRRTDPGHHPTHPDLQGNQKVQSRPHFSIGVLAFI